ncbi:uncharacterized protein LOC126322547 [Schistocerca gregaria]|uniref:uncharacterized protein LOC126322547 n=1 Tax=Schistocerca gregaria TaxID=7010 RepID=UPI00211E6406|nr:uncharacterized protein LOC126322547 [Schistocerca gregaria]XP_049850365.1 uncharacterized protein LOC126322547 [Schistocerca gregaria]
MYLADLCSSKDPPVTQNLAAPEGPSKSGLPPDERPSIVLDVKQSDGSTLPEKFYLGPVLGKGAYALCMEVTNSKTNSVYACKMYSRSKLATPTSKDRVLRELRIHQGLRHQHIVKFFFWGLNAESIYFILEKCNNNSLRRLLSVRKILNESEARYFLRQLLLAVNFLHQKRICHRDLKLDNIFLHDMTVKLGDFGFSIILRNGEMTKTFCGTPNYIAPEVLNSLEYSLPIDVWAIGVILYSMLYGKGPFEMKTAKETYLRIKSNKYSFSGKTDVSEEAKNLIKSCLDPDPARRPLCSDILLHPFLTKFGVPKSVPLVQLNQLGPSKVRRPLTDIANICSADKNDPCQERPHKKKFLDQNLCTPKQAHQTAVKPVPVEKKCSVRAHRPVTCTPWSRSTYDENIKRIYNRIQKIISYAESLSPGTTEVNEQSPEKESDNSDILKRHLYFGHHWIVKWVDYSQKFGIGYQLCNGTKGIKLKDHTSITDHPDKQTIVYTKFANRTSSSGAGNLLIRETLDVTQDQSSEHSESIKMRARLLAIFSSYMSNLPFSSGLEIQCKGSSGTQVPEVSLLGWTKSTQAICFILTNYTVQVNFFDHVKIVLSLPDLEKDPFGIEVITLVQEGGVVHSHVVDSFIKKGLITPEVAKRLHLVSSLLMQCSVGDS